LTRSALAEPPDAPPLRGSQRPRVLWVPPGAVSSAGREAVELAASVGLDLDPWQQWLLDQGLSERSGGNWLAFEIVELLPRQNGKGGVLEAVALACLYLFGDRFTGWSAHEFKTCREGFLRVRALIENSDELRRRAKKPRASHGEEEIELLNGQRLRFMARSMGAGRGFTGERLFLDEAQHLGESALEAILPTMSARPNPQVWYAATAPDPKIAPCEVLARLRKRALKQSDPSLVYAEWSIDPHVDECARDCQAHDDPGSVQSWLKANPAAGIRISVEHIAREYAAMSAAGFARERLGVGNWPVRGDEGWAVIAEAIWRACADLKSEVPKSTPVAFAADVTPDRSWASIGACGRRADGKLHVEVIDHRPKTDWVVPRLVELIGGHMHCGVGVDAAGPAGSFIAPLEEAGFVSVAPAAKAPDSGLALVKPTAQQAAQAFAGFYDAPEQDALRHLDQPELASALAGATTRPLGDARAWSRRDSSVDISPLVAVTVAKWVFANRGHLAGETTPEPDIF